MKVLKVGTIWCSGCIVMKPRWAQIQLEYPWLESISYDGDEETEIVEQYHITDFPTYIFVDKDGKELKRFEGEVSKKVLIETILKYKDQ